MRKRTFFLGAVLLALIGFVIHITARGFLEEAMHHEVVHQHETLTQHIAYTPDSQALVLSRHYNVLTVAGIVLTALSTVCMLTALARREQGWYLILTLLLVFDVVLAMLL